MSSPNPGTPVRVDDQLPELDHHELEPDVPIHVKVASKTRRSKSSNLSRTVRLAALLLPRRALDRFCQYMVIPSKLARKMKRAFSSERAQRTASRRTYGPLPHFFSNWFRRSCGRVCRWVSQRRNDFSAR